MTSDIDKKIIISVLIPLFLLVIFSISLWLYRRNNHSNKMYDTNLLYIILLYTITSVFLSLYMSISYFLQHDKFKH